VVPEGGGRAQTGQALARLVSGDSRGQSRARAALAGTLAVPALVAGCLPAPATREARLIADLYTVVMLIAAVVAAIVLGLTIFMILRYRRRGAIELPPQVHGDLRFEAIWTGLPIVTIVVLFILTLGVLGPVDAVGDAGEPGAEVRVEAYRWGWRFTYPADSVVVEGIGEPGPELVVPVGEPVRITLVGVDVNHAFYVPQFLFKRDAIAGRDNVFEFTVDRPGTYRGQCAEFCGVGHAKMPFTVRAVARAEYDTWVASATRASVTP
jgi:cytochrome c oxidase subunit 2